MLAGNGSTGGLLVVALLLHFRVTPSTAPPGPPRDEPDEERPLVEHERVVVTPTRGAESELEVPASVHRVDFAEALRSFAANAPDALRTVPGLTMQKSNQGAGSPVLRGRSGKDVVLLIDGQRFSNTTFRRNHQYLNTVDLYALDAIEVVSGPASVLYGSDAMGGAVNLLARRPVLAGFDDWSGRFRVQYDTAGEGLVTHLGSEAEWDGWGIAAGVTSRNFGDLEAGRVGGDPLHAVDTDGEQVPSAYRSRDFHLSVARRLSAHDTLDYLLLYSRQWDVPSSDRLIPNEENPNPSDRVRDFDPQRLRWHALRWSHDDEGALLESFQAIASLNAPVEGRRRVRNATPDLESVERDELTIPGLSLQAGLRVAPGHLLTLGGEGYFERIDSTSHVIDSTAGTVTPGASGRYPDGARYDTLGLFAQDEWRFGDGWEWVNGVRYSRIAVDLDFEGITVGPAGPFGALDETWDDVTFASGVSKQLDEARSVYLSVARGYRAPNLDDLAVIGDFAGGNRVPSFDVEPEKVWNLELGSKHVDQRTRAQVAGGVSWYRDLLTNRFAFSSGGEDYFVVDNADRAVIYFGEALLEQELVECDSNGLRHVLDVQAAAQWGRNQSAREPVSKIPAPTGLLGWRVEWDAPRPAAGAGGGGLAGTNGAGGGAPGSPRVLRRWWAELFAQGALAQRRLAEVDRSDPRFPDTGTPAWWTLNVRAATDLASDTTLSIGLENLFNYRYRIHGSGLDAPGRNLIVALEQRF